MKKRTVAVVMAAAMTIGMMVTGVSVQAGVEDKTLIVGFDAEYPPFGYKDDNGENCCLQAEQKNLRALPDSG